MTNDPVCGITLDHKSPHKCVHAGRIYAFCCLTCKAAFDKEPGRYVSPSGATPAGLRPSSPPPAPPFLITSSIGRVLQVILAGQTSDESRRRPSWLLGRRHSREGR